MPTPSGPRSIEAVAGGAWRSCATPRRAPRLIDARTLRVHELGGFSEPRYTAAAPDGRHAYVTDAKLGQVVVVDVVRGRIAGRCEVGSLARHVTIAPGGGTVWTALGSKAPAIAVVDASDPTRPRLQRTVEPSFLAHDVDWDRTARRVWVTSGAEDAIAIHDARSGRVLHRLPAGEPPQHVVVLDDAAYVTSGDSASLRVHAVDDGRLLHESWVPVGSYNVTFGAGRICTPRWTRHALRARRARRRRQQPASRERDPRRLLRAASPRTLSSRRPAAARLRPRPLPAPPRPRRALATRPRPRRRQRPRRARRS